MKAFNSRLDKLEAQYNAYEPLPGLHVKGRLTMGENVADLAGLTVAYDAYHASLRGRPAPVIDGFTGDQRFYLGWAQVWRTKYREAALRQQLLTDPHSPGEQRVDTVRNLDPWYEAYQRAAGSEAVPDAGTARPHLVGWQARLPSLRRGRRPALPWPPWDLPPRRSAGLLFWALPDLRVAAAFFAGVLALAVPLAFTGRRAARAAAVEPGEPALDRSLIRAALDGTADAAAITDADGALVVANQAYEQWFGAAVPLSLRRWVGHGIAHGGAGRNGLSGSGRRRSGDPRGRRPLSVALRPPRRRRTRRRGPQARLRHGGRAARPGGDHGDPRRW